MADTKKNKEKHVKMANFRWSVSGKSLIALNTFLGWKKIKLELYEKVAAGPNH